VPMSVLPAARKFFLAGLLLGPPAVYFNLLLPASVRR
jgi:hypothetical protein